MTLSRCGPAHSLPPAALERLLVPGRDASASTARILFQTMAARLVCDQEPLYRLCRKFQPPTAGMALFGPRSREVSLTCWMRRARSDRRTSGRG